MATQQKETSNEIEVEEFEATNSGASKTFPQQCSALRKNGYVVIKNRPCKIVDMSTSKTGKHGHAKVHLTALDIFTNRKLEDICPSTHNMEVPNVLRKEYEVLGIEEDGFLQLMSAEGEMREDLKLNDLCNKDMDEAKVMFEKLEDNLVLTATVWKAMDEEVIKELRVTVSK